jgi:hypothetical protein
MSAHATGVLAQLSAVSDGGHARSNSRAPAALQSLVDPDNLLDGDSDTAKRERIGNAATPYAAQAIADLMGETILLSIGGESFMLSAQPIWVRPVAIALSLGTPEG